MQNDDQPIETSEAEARPYQPAQPCCADPRPDCMGMLVEGIGNRCRALDEPPSGQSAADQIAEAPRPLPGIYRNVREAYAAGFEGARLTALSILRARPAAATVSAGAMAALRELVDLQDIKQRMAKIASTPGYLEDPDAVGEYDRLSTDYSRRRPRAWEAARVTLRAASAAPPCDMDGMCLDCQPRGPGGGCPDAAPAVQAAPAVPHPYTDDMLVAAMEASVAGRPSVDDDTYVRSILDAAREAAPTPPAVDAVPLSAAARDVLAERRRQISVEGWTPEHDDEHDDGSMSIAAACYAMAGLHGARPGGFHPEYLSKFTRWDSSWFKWGNRRRNLVKAGALILAEIERLDRAAMQSPTEQAGSPQGSAE